MQRKRSFISFHSTFLWPFLVTYLGHDILTNHTRDNGCRIGGIRHRLGFRRDLEQLKKVLFKSPGLRIHLLQQRIMTAEFPREGCDSVRKMGESRIETMWNGRRWRGIGHGTMAISKRRAAKGLRGARRIRPSLACRLTSTLTLGIDY